jgi:hypothetical protein
MCKKRASRLLAYWLIVSLGALVYWTTIGGLFSHISQIVLELSSAYAFILGSYFCM